MSCDVDPVDWHEPAIGFLYGELCRHGTIGKHLESLEAYESNLICSRTEFWRGTRQNSLVHNLRMLPSN